MDTKLDALAHEVAKEYAGKDWHRLTRRQVEIVRMLEESGYLTVPVPANGFVGMATSGKGTPEDDFFHKRRARKEDPAVGKAIRRMLGME